MRLGRLLARGHAGLPLSFVLVAATGVVGCLNRPIDRLEPKLTQQSFASVPSGAVEKIDLLLAIDNSISMADKQKILADAVPILVDRFVNPICVDPSLDNPVPSEQIARPASVDDDCPVIESNGAQVQTEREFKPIRDIHVGIVSSSLGSLGSGKCGEGAEDNDQGHLLSRTAPIPPSPEPGPDVPTFKSQGFLAWDPDGKYGDPTNVDAFEATFKEMVVGVGQSGCGFEMSLESVYRFLVDPEPYAKLQKEGKTNKKVGIDQDLLTQRANFLRPDSLVAIVLLSDENDCSVVATGGSWAVLGGGLDRGSDQCKTNGPNDACCYSCSSPEEDVPAECADGCTGDLAVDHDSINTVCWDQKRRFGADLLYPTSRYVNAFTEKKIDPAHKDLKPTDPDGGEDNPLLKGRPPGLVYFAGIVGVPWQAIARRDGDGKPSLALGFQTNKELTDARVFDAIAGDPDTRVPPTDPFMVEDVEKRSGKSELLGYSPTEPNPINGGDRTPTTEAQNSEMGLQYACTFPITPDADAVNPDCQECKDGDCDNPVCNGELQIAAKAVPGLRQLAVVRDMGLQGIAGSVCPTDQDEELAPDYGYTPAVGAILDALKVRLQDVQCLDFSLKPDAAGAVDCIVLESSKDDVCKCDAKAGHIDPPANHDTIVTQVQESKFYDEDHNCMCELQTLTADALHDCQFEKDVPSGVDGWCYLDRTPTNPVGEPKLVPPLCGDYEARMLRIVGEGQPAAGSTLHIWCNGENAD
jgi:hypothetical protein